MCVCVCFAGPLSCKEVLCAVLAPVMEVGKDARSDDKDAPPLLMCQNQGPWNHSGFLRKIDLFRKEIGMGRNFEFHSHFNSQEVCGEQMLLINTSDQIIARSHDTTTTLRPGRCWKKGYREDMGRRPDSRVSKATFKGLFGPPKMGRAFCWNSETPKTLAIDLVSREFHKFAYIDKFGLIGVFCIFWDAPHRSNTKEGPSGCMADGRAALAAKAWEPPTGCSGMELGEIHWAAQTLGCLLYITDLYPVQVYWNVISGFWTLLKHSEIWFGRGRGDEFAFGWDDYSVTW